jgi:hypothetical protein
VADYLRERLQAVGGARATVARLQAG